MHHSQLLLSPQTVVLQSVLLDQPVLLAGMLKPSEHSGVVPCLQILAACLAWVPEGVFIQPDMAEAPPPGVADVFSAGVFLDAMVLVMSANSSLPPDNMDILCGDAPDAVEHHNLDDAISPVSRPQALLTAWPLKTAERNFFNGTATRCK